MNYRHSFHAGNFADVFKHALLTRILVYLMRKDGALRYIDTHAGTGLYDLTSLDASRTQEWQGGIGRLKGPMPADVQALLQPYLDAVGPLDDDGRPKLYPGSPVIAQNILRAQDRLSLCELHPEDVLALERAIGRDSRVKMWDADGYAGLKAFVPPLEKRGLVLIDPPFEQRDEFQRMARAVIAAHRKWAVGTFALWYPVKDLNAVQAFCDALVGAGIKKILRVELQVRRLGFDGPLGRTGLILINPPYVLESELGVLMPFFAQTLAQDSDARFEMEWLAGE